MSLQGDVRSDPSVELTNAFQINSLEWSSLGPPKACEDPLVDEPKGRLYVVATPLGNMEDVTLRALRVLRQVDLVACEDTRRSGALLRSHGIATRTTSYFEHNERWKGERILAEMRAGHDVARVCDAGTPGISDPGFRLVREAREAGLPVVPVPGPSAVVTALSAAGIPADRFVFDGFLPVKPGKRIHRLEALRELETTVVCYESPHRILATLGAIGRVFGQIEIVVARELTKKFEEIVRGTPEALVERFEASEVRGEFTLVIPYTKGPCPSPRP